MTLSDRRTGADRPNEPGQRPIVTVPVLGQAQRNREHATAALDTSRWTSNRSHTTAVQPSTGQRTLLASLDRPRPPWSILFRVLARAVFPASSSGVRALAGSPRLEAPASDQATDGDCCNRPEAATSRRQPAAAALQTIATARLAGVLVVELDEPRQRGVRAGTRDHSRREAAVG